jgi:putative zinc ribbon protein
MPDQEITCQDCQQPFRWTEGEQEFYAKQQFSRPKRCRDCREKRRASKGDRG